MKTAFDFWLNTDEGIGCNTPFDNLHKQQPYLQNRLRRAYDAGAKNIGINEENAEWRKKHMEALTEIYNLKKFIRNLTKERKQKSTVK